MGFALQTNDLILRNTRYPLNDDQVAEVQALLKGFVCEPQDWKTEYMVESAACNVLLQSGYTLVSPTDKEKFHEAAGRVKTPAAALVKLETEFKELEAAYAPLEEENIELTSTVAELKKKNLKIAKERTALATARQSDSGKVAAANRYRKIAEDKLKDLQAKIDAGEANIAEMRGGR